MLRHYRRVVLQSAPLLVMPAALILGCAIPDPQPVFVPKTRPAKVKEQFTRGQLGVIRSTFDVSYLIGAYRMLAPRGGRPMNPVEFDALYGDQSKQLGLGYYYDNGWRQWRDERAALTPEGAPRSEVIRGYRMTQREGSIQYYINCTDDAFGTAARVLRQLKGEWAESDPRLVSWVFAQDQVFRNCSGNEAQPLIPPAATTRMDPALASYRRYQVAAAHFYTGELRKAYSLFLQIAKETDSPYRTIAPYLAARALLRADQLAGDDAAFPECLRLADSILANPELSEWHQATANLRGILLLRHQPAQRAAELSSIVMQGSPAHTAEEFAQAAIDLRWLLRRREDYRGRPLTVEKDWGPIERASELAAWVGVMRRGGDGGGKEAVARWKKSRSAAWLAPALAFGAAGAMPEVLEAAAKVPPASPAYEMIAYYRVARSPADEARQLADQLLEGRGLRVEATRNLVLHERWRLARDFTEFLKYGQRRPEPQFAEIEGEWPARTTPLPRGAELAFDEDAIEAFNFQLPLASWVDASRSPVLPSYLQFRIAQTGWLRAAMLGREAEAKAMLSRVVELQPEAAGPAEALLAASNAEELAFGATYLYLRMTTLGPQLQRPGMENEDFMKPFQRRRCEYTLERAGVPPPAGPLAWQSRTDWDAARAEEQRLRAVVAEWTTTPVLERVLGYAKRHPDDSHVPEALHRGVKMSFLGCNDPSTGALSEQAHTLLHKRYPASPWTAKTPYWYR